MNIANSSTLLSAFAKFAILDIRSPPMAAARQLQAPPQTSAAPLGKTMSALIAQLDTFSILITSAHQSVIAAESGTLMAYAPAATTAMNL